MALWDPSVFTPQYLRCSWQDTEAGMIQQLGMGTLGPLRHPLVRHWGWGHEPALLPRAPAPDLTEQRGLLRDSDPRTVSPFQGGPEYKHSVALK